MMNDILTWAGVFLSGAALGALFFGGLWWTVRKGLSAKRPALLFLGSLLLRSAVAVAGFCFVAGGNWQKLLACLLGFIFMRMAVTRLTRPAARTVDGTTAGGPNNITI